jgi:hypothetical protein
MGFLIIILIRVLEIMFVIGMLGSAGVIIVAGIEDTVSILESEDTPSAEKLA